MAMALEPVCERKSTRCLKIPLRSTEQIYLIFLLPAILSCCVYITHFGADLVVAIQHFREENPVWGSCTILFIYAPAIAYFILTISRPDWWMTENEKVSKGALTWFALQICQLIAFPFFALYRFAGQIVVIVDAILLSGDERTKSLNVAAAPAAIELYFFLQAWFQAAPQAIFQTHLLFRERTVERTYQSIVVHLICIFSSIVVLAIQTTSFQRFESQKINGRKVPWAMWLKKYRAQELGDLEEKKLLQSKNPVAASEQTESTTNESNLPAGNSESGVEPQRVVLQRQISATPPLPPRNAQIIPPPAPLRGITSVTILQVPEMPAPPRPDSIAQDSVENNTELQGKSTDQIFCIHEKSDETSKRWKGLRIPKRIYAVKGMEEDDPVGKFVAFLWWFFFIVARVFAIALFYEFYPLYLIGVLGVHYILMLIFLFYHAKDYNITTFIVNVWLGFVYIVSIIEYRIKFKYADKWLLTYYIFVIIENSIMTATWFVLSDWDSFWYSYMFYAIILSMGLCLISTCVYQILFKPGNRRIYAS
ncbi:hypothetical protein PV325_008871 [Microctonus aethiopoides]|uniref:XK-related protein n=1 Tax=Microctonus aethiopoides TaxID=144406 RepID=A0AA39FLM6_9HYME|nr:hypothetical protein PV326_006001 [Microctonus aethiopoides]KAK0089151.1 hypothetical protein PV325_008871 [Microctonus aethiopoides]KAK0171680.1 hypothetical protein PV328_005102 [Microctonus aethiopoides]